MDRNKSYRGNLEFWVPVTFNKIELIILLFQAKN